MEHQELRQLISARALDALDEDETRLVDEHVETCAECARELDELREVASTLAFSTTPVDPPPGLLDRILAQTGPGAEADVEPEPEPASRPAPAARHRRRAWPWRGMTFGFGAATAVLAVAAAVLLVQLGDARDQRDHARASASRDAVALAAVAGPNARLVSVAPGGRFAGSFVHSGSGAVLIIPGLQKAPAGKTYEAWLIDAQNHATPAGTFDASGSTTAVPISGDVGNAHVVAVTVEPNGGTQQPTSKPILAATLA
jgi:anti-sigma-K factor RskA